MQGILFEPESTWKPPTWEELPSWAEAKRVCIDVETKNPDIKKLGTAVRRGGFMCGIGFAIEDGPSHYLPIRHLSGGNMDERGVFEYLREQTKVFKGEIVGANLGYDLDFMWEKEIEFKGARFYRDVQIADPLLYELHMRYSLDHIAHRLGIPGKDETVLKEAAKEFGLNPKADLWKLHSKYVGAYAQGDVIAPLRILRKQEKMIDEADLWRIYDMESRLIPVLVRMKRRGVKIDLDKLAQVEAYSLAEEIKALKIVKDITGITINVGDIMQPTALLPALDFIGVKPPMTAKTKKPSITSGLLRGLNHPLGDALLRARKVNKLRTTFAESVREHMVNGRIHCDFKQIAMENDKDDEESKEEDNVKGARYGRLACNKPNLQQQPSRDEFASFWRSIYVPEDGALWNCNDYSQQEPRWTTHFAAVLNLPMAKMAAEKYCTDPKTDNHVMMAELTKLPRKQAKELFLGICYGEGGAKLCRTLNLPTRWAVKLKRGKITYFENREQAFEFKKGHEKGFVWEAAGIEGQKILNDFNERVPYVRALAQRVEKKAKERGCIYTIGGRRLNFEQKNDGSFDYTYRALNRLIQGSSADQVKLAMIELDSRGHYMQLQVHDEIDSSVGTLEEAHEMALVMREIVTSSVPFKVDVEIGPNWGEIKLNELIDGQYMTVEKDKKATPWIDWRKEE